jgi:uncharacterized protein YjbI with pentapeptide repeats
MAAEMSLLPAAIRIARARGMEFPADVDEYGLRVVNPDFTSSRGFRWPFPGSWAEASGPFLDHRGPCPRAEGDGICVARSWRGMASAGIPAITVLLVGWRDADRLGEGADKVRARRVFVVDVTTVGAMLKVREVGEGADLHGSNLGGVNLRGADPGSANLSYADLHDANLRGANLGSANLYGANLSSADLRYADLRYADLRYSDLRCADLSGADLRDANLRGANLGDANMNGANLYGANLSSADLRYADLRYADLRCADLSGASLRGVYLRDADLSGADLRDANMNVAVRDYAGSRGAIV